jgi:DNA-binding LacI/PurR family transcriptional regulator
VVGVGEVELGRYLPVPLTYVALPRYETRKAAAALALTLVDGELPRDVVMRLPVKLIASESG